MNRIEGGAAGARSAPRRAAAGLLLAAGVWAGVWGAANAQPVRSVTNQNAAFARPEKPSTDPGDKVTCKYDEVTGTRLGREKICHTRREWDQLNKDAVDWINTNGRNPPALKAAAPGGPGPH